MAVVIRIVRAVLSVGAALASVGAGPGEEARMLEAFERASNAIAYAAAGVALFSLVWAGFLLMSEGSEERSGRSRSAVVLAVAGLAIALSARGLAALVRSGVIPVPPN